MTSSTSALAHILMSSFVHYIAAHCCTSDANCTCSDMQFYEDNCLLEQRYVKDDSKKVSEVLKEVGKAMGADLEIRDFVRYQCGEGLDKEQSSFAEDVAQALQQTG